MKGVSTPSIRQWRPEPQRQVKSAEGKHTGGITGDESTRSSPTGELLLVDDDPTVLNILSSSLASVGYRCHTTNDPEEAIRQVVHNDAVSVVLSDIYMPSMTGFQFIDRISAQLLDRPCPRFLLLTAQPSMQSVVDALRLGVCDFLTKPIRISDLRAGVERALMQAEEDRKGYDSPLATVERLIKESQGLTEHLLQLAKTSSATSDPVMMLHAAGHPNHEPCGTDDSAMLHVIEALREIRARYAQHKLDDVAWDLMLELARAERLRQRISVSGLMISSGNASSTTLLRRINDLAERGYIERLPDPNDARRDFVFLTSKGSDLISSFLRTALSCMSDLAHFRHRR